MFLHFFSLVSSAQAISPNDYGLSQAKNAIERYWILFKTHTDALKNNLSVNYEGIHELHIEIPHNAKSIPLRENTDFKGMKLYVTNKSKDLYLFTLIQKATPINISKEDFNSAKYSKCTKLVGG